MRSSKTGRKTSSVASAVWHVALSCWNQMLPISFSSSIFVNFVKFVQHRPITIAIACNGLILAYFQRKMAQICLWTKIRTKQWLVLGAPAFQCMLAGFLCPKCDNFVCLHSRQDQNEPHLKRRFFFAKIGIFCKSTAGPLPSVIQEYTQPYSVGGRIKLIVCQIRHELSVAIHEISTYWE